MNSQSSSSAKIKGSQTGPLEIYEAKIASGELRKDPDQHKACELLQKLFDVISTPKKKGLFSFGKKGETPKGVYLYGGVGRGKSMIMDLFYETLPEDLPKERIHFHAFMIRAHDFMHEARRIFDRAEAVFLDRRQVALNRLQAAAKVA